MDFKLIEPDFEISIWVARILAEMEDHPIHQMEMSRGEMVDGYFEVANFNGNIRFY